MQGDDGGKSDICPDVTDDMSECRGDDGCARIKQQDDCEIREKEEVVERGENVLPAGVVCRWEDGAKPQRGHQSKEVDVEGHGERR